METTAGRAHGVPELNQPTPALLRRALAAGWQDFRAAPAFGLLVSTLCLLAGWGMTALTVWAGHTFWLVLGVFGFPLIAPFAALGTYEVSRLRGLGEAPSIGRVFRALWTEGGRHLPMLCALMMVMLLFWFFLGHMIFALFLGLKPMTNIMSSGEVFLSPNGLMMLAFGTAVGAGFALFLFSICVIGLPLLLDREVDCITATARSVRVVMAHPAIMLGWAAFIAVLLVLAMLPAFLGLLVVLPWLGHASWHIYAGLKAE
ncbi:Uncharacterized membrane protein [Roseovarius nanhaiticus]|uniref:Uncharacterized membrane protein n=1 Tax=Roseovarius nanhaiticus TaxID=573024 RepID=A0A1N7GV29_9RHOB|nr:DUF2189 domain-containing protein [Roseovarius nanhaiticus]SEL31303.1 Uncharacterized membrane protein [Roseovarius nanhaiticus]SIS16406.1 Uncharacterized membrane protein [Roseovarius nanhaiticus]